MSFEIKETNLKQKKKSVEATLKSLDHPECRRILPNVAAAVARKFDAEAQKDLNAEKIQLIQNALSYNYYKMEAEDAGVVECLQVKDPLECRDYDL